VWSRFKAPVLIAYSERDQCVPASVDKAALVAKWRAVNPEFVSELSGVIPGASHSVDEEDAQEWLAERVARFLESV
jgi:pimeloyl-ACP methyl ester carboxylesterase